jgi:hypothetical protein
MAVCPPLNLLIAFLYWLPVLKLFDGNLAWFSNPMGFKNAYLNFLSFVVVLVCRQRPWYGIISPPNT